jgi:hypothetical protein
VLLKTPYQLTRIYQKKEKIMSTDSAPTQSTGYKIGWWMLFVLAILMTLNHLVMMFVLPAEFVLFAGWTGFNLYALLVLHIPFRKGEKWAWNATWILPIVTLSPLNGDPTIAPYYIGAAVLFVVGLFLTRSAFSEFK